VRTRLDGQRLDDIALRRIEATCADPDPDRWPNGVLVGHSGGKDSVVVAHLMARAGVPHRLRHNLTTADAPETVRFVRSLPDVEINRPAQTMWALIRRKGLPPRRNMRYCCECQKEREDKGCLVVTGVRAAESVRRSKRHVVEACYTNRNWFFHPIIAWTTADVWQYIREHDLPYCPLYDEGFSRVGCVLCPMVSHPDAVRAEVDRWPRLAAAWERAVKATFDDDALDRFDDPEDYWHWWLYERRHSRKQTPGQKYLFDSDPDTTAPEGRP